MRIEARAFVTQRVWGRGYDSQQPSCYSLTIVRGLESTDAAVLSGTLRVVTGSAAERVLRDAFDRDAEVRVTLYVPEDGEAACSGRPEVCKRPDETDAEFKARAKRRFGIEEAG